MLPGSRNPPAAMRQKARGRSPCRSAGSRRERQTGCRPAAAFPAQRPVAMGPAICGTYLPGKLYASVSLARSGGSGRPCARSRAPHSRRSCTLRTSWIACPMHPWQGPQPVSPLPAAPTIPSSTSRPSGRRFIVIGSPRCGRPGISAAGIRPERPGRIHASCDARHGRMGAQTAGAGNPPTQAKAAGAS